MSELGTRLREMREQQGLSVLQVGEDTGIPASRYAELERGVRIPTDTQRERLETYYELKAGTLSELAAVAAEAAW